MEAAQVFPSWDAVGPPRCPVCPFSALLIQDHEVLLGPVLWEHLPNTDSVLTAAERWVLPLFREGNMERKSHFPKASQPVRGKPGVCSEAVWPPCLHSHLPGSPGWPRPIRARKQWEEQGILGTLGATGAAGGGLWVFTLFLCV